MVTARRVGRWALIGVGSVVLLLVFARVGLAVYLATPAGRAMVARQISKRIGMPVEVQSVHLGMVGSSSIGMTVYDPAITDRSKAEVFSVEPASADVSLVDLATGHVAPTDVELKGANLILHVAADGKVLTTLPKLPQGGGEAGPTPKLVLTGGSITIRQDGRPEFALHNLNLSAEPQPDGSVKLSGTIDDPAWSKWTIAGGVNTAAKTGSVEASTPDGPLTMDKLRSLPFVLPEVWQSVQPDGRGAIALRVWQSSGSPVDFSVEVKPAAASLAIPDAGVALQKVTGTIRVASAGKDTKVALEDCKAELAGGGITATGEANFLTDRTTVGVSVTASKLDIKQLPASWGLRKDLEGKLSGKAKLDLKFFADGRFEPDGSGEGLITDVKLLGFKADDIPIHLRKAGKRLQLHEPKQAAGTGRRPARAEPVRCAAPRPVLQPEGLGQHSPGQRPGNAAFGLKSAPQPVAARQATQPPKKDPPKVVDPKADPKDDTAPTLDATIRLRDIDVAQLLEKLELKLGYTITGKVTVEASIGIPVAQATSTRAMRFSGKITSAALTFEGLTVRDVSAHMVYTNGTLTLKDLSGRIDQPGKSTAAPGTFRGNAFAAVNPPGDATFDFSFENIALGEVLKAVPNLPLAAAGTVSGKVALKSRYEKLWDPAVWSGTGEITSSELVVEKRTIKDVRFAAAVGKGTLTLTDAHATVEGIPLSAEATVGLTGKYAFTAAVKTTGTSVADLRKLVPELNLQAPVEGVLETETKVSGTASPLDFTASGTITATKLTLARTSANHIAVKWEATPERLTIPELKADVFGGSLSGSLDYPLAADKRGKFDLAFKNLDAAAATELVPDFPVRVSGKVSGKVAGSIEPAKPGQSRVGTLDLDITAPRLTVQNIPADRLVGKAAIKNGVLDYSLEGKTLGGSFELKGRYPGAKKKGAEGGGAEEGKQDRGMLRIRGIDLARLATDLRLRPLAPLRGRLDASFDFANDLSAGSGRVTVTGLRWGNESVTQQVTGNLTLRDGQVELTDFTGMVAGGILRANARIRLHDTSRNHFFISLSGADAKQLFAGLPGVGGKLDGPVTIVARGRVGANTSISGSISMQRGTAAGIQVTDLRVPFEVTTGAGGYGRLTIRDAAVNAGSGRASADATVDWGVSTRVEARILFMQLPIRTVVPDLGDYGLFGNGKISGRFDLAGRDVRSADDLTGTLVATLNQTSVRELPIIRQATPFLNTPSMIQPFNAGDVRASLSRGVFRVERLALASPSAQLFADGTVTTSGRVDLNVVAHTGMIGPDVRGLQLLGLRLPVAGVLPLALVRDVTSFLSNRTVRLSITGTTSNPIVRVNVGALLTDQAVRFFLSRYVVPADVAGAVGLGTGFGTSSSK